MGLKLGAIAERLRTSLFFIPSLFILGALGLAWTTATADAHAQSLLADIPLVLTTEVGSARAVLGTVAGATLTVAGIVFSVIVVAVQLTSSQFSPRALRNFLRDRFQQWVVGIVVGTFTFSLVLLAVIDGTQQQPFKSLSVTVSVGLGVVTALAIVAFIDRSIHILQVGEIMRRIADETSRLARRHRTDHSEGERAELPESAPTTYTSERRGWIQQIDEDGLFRSIPPGAVARLDVRPGDFVNVGDPLAAVWADNPPASRRIAGAFAIGRVRTMQQDASYGLTQLVDIALRALSPGVNDPTTAIEALTEIGPVVEDLIRNVEPSVTTDGKGRRIYRVRARSASDFVRMAFAPIRLAGAGIPTVAARLIWELGRLANAFEQGPVVEAATKEARLTLAILHSSELPEADTKPVEQLAEELGLLPLPGG